MSDEIGFLEILIDTQPTGASSAEAWHSQFPISTAVLFDGIPAQCQGAINVQSLPAVYFVDENMTIRTTPKSSAGFMEAFAEAQKR